jgi:hypothetical protein
MHLTEFDDRLRAITSYLISSEALRRDASAERIARKAVERGLNSLSWEERFLYLGRVIPLAREVDQGGD